MDFLARMELFLTIVLVLSINTAKSQSSAEVSNRCVINQVYSRSNHWVDHLNCRDFQHTFLPYTEAFKGATVLSMDGNFSEITIDPAYENLEFINIHSTNLQKFELKHYTNLTKLKGVRLSGSEQTVKLDLTGAEKLKRLYLHDNKMLNYSCEQLKFTTLKRIFLPSDNLQEFDFSCLPESTVHLMLHDNKFLTLHSLDSLKNLTNLTILRLDWNRLQDFRFKYLPNSIEYVYVRINNITEFPDLSEVPHSHPVRVDIRGNPIRCTCALLRDFVQLLDTGNVTFAVYGGPALSCANGDSELADYPWSNNAAAIKLHDASVLDCLHGGEDDNNGNENNGSVDKFLVVNKIIKTSHLRFIIYEEEDYLCYQLYNNGNESTGSVDKLLVVNKIINPSNLRFIIYEEEEYLCYQLSKKEKEQDDNSN